MDERIDWFTAINLTQTSDKGYEISGHWNTYGTTYETISALIKTDANGNIQWYENSSSSEYPIYPLINPLPKIQTTDGGFASDESGSIIKTDSNGNLQWVKNLTFSYIDYTFPLHLSYLIETSDGALAGIGIGVTNIEHDSGYIYLVKTEAFLPLPSPTQLPNPIPTPINISHLIPTLSIITIVLIIAFAISLVLYRRYQKTKLSL